MVWNTNVIFPYIGNNHPNWLIFFRGVETTNQIIYWNILNINVIVIVFYISNRYYMMVIAYCITIPDFLLPRTLLRSIYNISIELLVNCTYCFGCPKGVSRIGLLDYYAILDSKKADLFHSTIPMSSNKYCWCFTNLVIWCIMSTLD